MTKQDQISFRLANSVLTFAYDSFIEEITEDPTAEAIKNHLWYQGLILLLYLVYAESMSGYFLTSQAFDLLYTHQKELNLRIDSAKRVHLRDFL